MNEHQHQEPHLPHGSVWPFWIAMAIAAVGISLLAFGRMIPRDPIDGGLNPSQTPLLAWMLMGGAVLFLALMITGWVREDIRWWNSNTGTGNGMPRAGIVLFISSEVFIFGALFSSYFTFQRLAGGHWPDLELELPFRNAVIFTLVLFSSSATIHHAEKKLLQGDHKAFRTWWGITILLGLIFLAGQVFEYTELVREGHTLGSAKFMTMFFMITGTHGLHVFGGLVALLIAWIRANKGQFDEHRHAYPQSTSMYWHFVDIVWVFVFTVLYIVPTFVLG